MFNLKKIFETIYASSNSPQASHHFHNSEFQKEYERTDRKRRSKLWLSAVAGVLPLILLPYALVTRKVLRVKPQKVTGVMLENATYETVPFRKHIRLHVFMRLWTANLGRLNVVRFDRDDGFRLLGVSLNRPIYLPKNINYEFVPHGSKTPIRGSNISFFHKRPYFFEEEEMAKNWVKEHTKGQQIDVYYNKWNHRDSSMRDQSLFLYFYNNNSLFILVIWSILYSQIFFADSQSAALTMVDLIEVDEQRAAEQQQLEEEKAFSSSLSSELKSEETVVVATEQHVAQTSTPNSMSLSHQ